MADGLHEISDWLNALLSQASPAQVRAINRRVGYELRRSQAQRIAAQRNPDGTAYVPRAKAKNLRAKKGVVRKRAMFARLRTLRFFKVAADADSLAVAFRGRVGAIATTHQYGDRRVSEKTGRVITTPKRELLGLTDAEMEMLIDAYLRHLAAID